MLRKNWQNREKLQTQATRQGFGEGLLAAAKLDPNIVALCADLTGSLNMTDFQAAFPDRFFQVGVAEQNMAGVGAGLALSGKTVFISSFAAFNPGRNWEQIRVSIGYNNANVKVIGSHAGLSVGEDGATHQALEDLATMRVIPNMSVISPADGLEAKKATLAIARKKGPFYLRLCRAKTPLFTSPEAKFVIGQAQVLQPGRDLTLIATGPLVYEALAASLALAKLGLKAGVINLHTVKPIDQQAIVKAAKATGAIVTIEDHQAYGGLGSAVAEVLVKHCPVPQEFVAFKDTFGESGQPAELFHKYGLDAKHIFTAVKRVLKRK